MSETWICFRWLTVEATEIKVLICWAFNVDDGTVTMLIASLNP